MSELNINQLEKWQEHFEKQLDDEEEREQLYKQQAEDIIAALASGKKVNDGYYTWSQRIADGIDPVDKRKVRNCVIVAARNILLFKKGYTPMFCQFQINEEVSLTDNLREAVIVMLKRQNGEFVAEQID